MEQLVNFIIRPPRAVYKPESDLPSEEFTLRGRFFRRKEIQVKNNQGNVLQCSHYLPRSVPEGLMLPCVIYCHGNSGCRLDATEAAEILLPSNITVFALDFSGSGLSEGEYVTLGWNEKEDLRAVVNYLRTEGNVSLIGLWGRSMGAVTSLMYGAEDPSIAGMVLDSPFSNLVDLMMELVDSYRYPLPKFTVKFAIQHMRKIIKKKADFDIMSLDAVEVAKCCFVPALLGHATDDDFIRPHHSDFIFGAYAGDKNIIKFDGDHNSPRPQFYFDSITIFFHNVLNPPKDGFDEALVGQENWDEVIGLHHQGPAQLLSDSDIDLARIRRPMSRMEFPHDAPLIELSEVKEDTREGATAPSSSHSSLVPDGGFLPCTLEDWSDVPYSPEEEEKMLNEAMSLSLRDWQAQHSKEQSQTDIPDVTNETLPPVNVHLKNHEPNPSKSNNEGFATPAAHTEHGNCCSSDSTDDLSCKTHVSISTNETLPPVNLTLKTHDHYYDSLEDSKTRSSSVTNENLPPGKDRHSEASVASRAHVGHSNDTNDISDKTQASIVVQRTASGKTLEGLIQRWGSFFKNK